MQTNSNSLKNLRNFSELTPEERKAIASKAGKKSAEKRQYNKTFKMATEWALSLPAIQGNPTVDMIKKKYPNIDNKDALVISVLAKGIQEGDVKALVALRDTVGEAPSQQLAFNNNAPMKIEIEVVE